MRPMRSYDGGVVAVATVFEAFVVGVGRVIRDRRDTNQQKKKVAAQVKGASVEIVTDILEKLSYASDMLDAFDNFLAQTRSLEDSEDDFTMSMARQIEVLLNHDLAYANAKSFDVWNRHKGDIFRSTPPQQAHIVSRFYNAVHPRIVRILILRESVFQGFHRFMAADAKFRESGNTDDLKAAGFALRVVLDDLLTWARTYMDILVIFQECFG
jgi:hypothetical protein